MMLHTLVPEELVNHYAHVTEGAHAIQKRDLLRWWKMNSVNGLRQLLISKGVANAEGVKTFSKLKELVNLAHEIRVPKEEEYQNGPRRAIRKTYCGSNSISGYETYTGKAGLNGMTSFLKGLPDLKSINKTEHPTELACVGLMIAVSDCPNRIACECNTKNVCDCRGGHCSCNNRCSVHSCSCESRCNCNYEAIQECPGRTTCNCYSVTLADKAKLCTCDSVVTY